MLLLVVATFSFAQAPVCFDKPEPNLSAFQAARGNWIANIAGYANSLFGALAVIEFAWSAPVMVLEKLTDRGDMQAFQFSSEGKLLMTSGNKGVHRR